MKLLLSFLVVVSACIPNKPQEQSLAGSIPIVITNNSKEELCHVSVESRMPHTTSLDLAKTYSGTGQSLMPGRSVRTSVKAGSYLIHATNCNFSVAVTDELQEWKVSGPLAVGVAGPETTAPASYQHIELKLRFVGGGSVPDAPAKPDCLPDGAHHDTSSLPCCHRVGYENGDNQRGFCY